MKTPNVINEVENVLAVAQEKSGAALHIDLTAGHEVTDQAETPAAKSPAKPKAKAAVKSAKPATKKGRK